MKLTLFILSYLAGLSILAPMGWAATLSSLAESARFDFSVAGIHLSLFAKTVVADEGSRLGTVIEWQDHTHNVEAEQQIEALIDAAVAGLAPEHLGTAELLYVRADLPTAA